MPVVHQRRDLSSQEAILHKASSSEMHQSILLPCNHLFNVREGVVLYVGLPKKKKKEEDVGKLVLSTVHSDNFRERSSPRGKTLMDIGLFWTEVEPNHFLRWENNCSIKSYLDIFGRLR